MFHYFHIPVHIQTIYSWLNTRKVHLVRKKITEEFLIFTQVVEMETFLYSRCFLDSISSNYLITLQVAFGFDEFQLSFFKIHTLKLFGISETTYVQYVRWYGVFHCQRYTFSKAYVLRLPSEDSLCVVFVWVCVGVFAHSPYLKFSLHFPEQNSKETFVWKGSLFPPPVSIQRFFCIAKLSGTAKKNIHIMNNT